MAIICATRFVSTLVWRVTLLTRVTHPTPLFYFTAVVDKVLRRTVKPAMFYRRNKKKKLETPF